MQTFHQIIQSAVGVARQFPGYENSIVLARLLAGLMVPALKQVSGYNQQPRIYTHAAALATAGSAANETDQEVIKWTANADFLWTGLSVINGADGSTAYNFDVQIVFGSNDRNLVNLSQGIHGQALMGTEQNPFVLPKAFILRKNTQITASIRTTGTVAVANCWVYCFGIDYYDANATDATRVVNGGGVPA